MKKSSLIWMLVFMGIFSVSAFAMGKGATKEEKAFGTCQIEAPKICGGYRSDMTKDEYAAYQKCTSEEWAKCWAVFKK